MATEQVGLWRPADQDPVLLMAGQTARYAVEPRDEYIFGIVAGQPMDARRGRERWLVRPGQLVSWAPSGAHAGSAIDAQSWSSRLIVVGAADLAALAGDQEADLPADITFPEPVLSDAKLASDFLRLHAALEMPTTRLERDEWLAEWLHNVLERSPAVSPARSPLNLRDDRALRVAYDYLVDEPERNVGLDECAAVAGIGKFRPQRVGGMELTWTPRHSFATHLAAGHRVDRRVEHTLRRDAFRLLPNRPGEVAAIATPRSGSKPRSVVLAVRQTLESKPGSEPASDLRDCRPQSARQRRELPAMRPSAPSERFRSSARSSWAASATRRRSGPTSACRGV